MADTTFVNGTVVEADWLNEINDHVHSDTPISPATTVHAANKIGITDVSAYYTATDVEGALAEAREYTDTGDATNATNLTTHLNDIIDAHDASAISVSAVAGLAATEVQAAVAELHTDIDNHIADATAAHAASAIGVTAVGNLTSTDVQAALEELQGDIDGLTPIGVGQTWQNLTGSRAYGTVYTNSTGRPIMVSASWSVVATGSMSLFIAGITVDSVSNGGTGAATYTLSGIVPDGASYSMSGSPSSSLGNWSELR